jgi:hypothetical protein
MAEVQPKAVLYGAEDNVWGIPTDSYAGCVKTLLQEKYFQVPRAGKDVWVRADVVADNPDALRDAIVPPGYNDSWLSASQQQAVRAVTLKP